MLLYYRIRYQRLLGGRLFPCSTVSFTSEDEAWAEYLKHSHIEGKTFDAVVQVDRERYHHIKRS